MRAFLLARLGPTLLVIFCSLTAVFFMTRLGGDPVLLFLPMDIQAKCSAPLAGWWPSSLGIRWSRVAPMGVFGIRAIWGRSSTRWGALAFRSGVGVLLTALTIPPLLARIRAEETLLRTQFGSEYDAYCRRTSRLIPGLY